MGRLIDIDALFDYFGNDAIDENTRSNIEYFVREKGTVEAIPKAEIKKFLEEGIKDVNNNVLAIVREDYIHKSDYENRLKADLKAILVELQLEIEECVDGAEGSPQFEQGVTAARVQVVEIIQQKINELKGDQEGEEPITIKNDCEHCAKTYGTLGCCSTVSNEWVYSCKEGHEEYARGMRKFGTTTKNDLEVDCQYTDEDIAKSFIEDVEAVKDQLPTTKNDLGVDAISRVDALALYCDKCGLYNCISKCASYRAVEKMPPVTPQARWIPDSERLPEKEGRYLITYCHQDKIDHQDKIETQEAVYVEEDDEAKWYDTTGIEITLAVIAWMPLPTPYEPQERSDKE